MLHFQEVDCLLQPVTALAFVPLQLDSTPLLFAGEGPFLRIYGHDGLGCLASERIFDSQSLHGITYLTIPRGPFAKESSTLVLLWGGSSVCLLLITDPLVLQAQPGFKIKRISSIIQTDDWILDASFKSGVENDGNFERDLLYAVLINGHNRLQYLRIQALSFPEYQYDWYLCPFIEGPKSILYSAHLGWSSTGRGLVAAGTVLGEVLLWSFHSDDITSNSKDSFSYFLHYIFLGHEGSVFGVRISDEPNDSSSFPVGRCLVSCSDDRTIRVWNISSVDDEPAPNTLSQTIGENTSSERSHEISSLSVATTMGHSSRIWGLRFLRHTREGFFLLSIGEDATSQIWHLRTRSDAVDIGQNGQAWDNHLQNECAFDFHAKRNIWSAATHRDVDGTYTISTGGADGRIVCFSLNDDRGVLSLADTSQTAELTVSSVLDQLSYDEKSSSGKTIAAKSTVKIFPEDVFTAFKGYWKVNRRLESEINTYQSGNFEGVASFEIRSPTDLAYDAEYLYIENGEFRSDQGLVIPATRRYVYRFQRKANIISAWFVKAEDGLTVDYLFHFVKFTPHEQESFLGKNGRRRGLLEANGQHLCINDDYQANYLFEFWGLTCNDWELKYHVKGPRKAYSATTKYVRDASHHVVNNDLMSEITLKTISNPYHDNEAGHGKTVSDKCAFNTYSWAGKDYLLALTTQGHLLLGSMSCSQAPGDETAKNRIKPECLWVKIDHLADLESSCLITSIQYLAMTLFVDKRGNMYFYQHDKKLIKSQIQLPDKATYLKSYVIDCRSNRASDQNPREVKLLIIASCLRPLKAYAFHVDVDLEISSYSLSSSFVLTLRPHFIVTSSCFANTKDLLFLGSRNGALAIYEHPASSTVDADLTPSFVSRGINGRDAITVIENLPRGSSTGDTGTYILTAGRDGTYSIHLITTEYRQNQDTSFGFQTVHTCKLPFGPNIEGACFNRITEELWLWGFSSKDFIVWNETRKTKVMNVECGGAHRNWAFLPGDDSDAGGQFAWTKASSCRIYSQPQASHQVLQPGGHGREIKAAAVSPAIKLLDGQFAKFVATGAEDTAIRIFLAPRIDDEAYIGPQSLECLGIFTNHTSGLHQLRWSPNGQLLFSAAGCEEFFVWHVRPAPCVKIGLVCEAICPLVTEVADLRIMGFDVMEMGSHDDETGGGGSPSHRYLLSMVYSDSTMRVYIYKSASTKSEFHLVSASTYTTFCLTQALYLPFHNLLNLCTASTDGHICFWSLSTLSVENKFSTGTTEPGIACPDALHNEMPTPSGHSTNLTWHSRTKIHQSSIKAMYSLPLSPSTFIILTGGDDGALGLARVTYSSNNSSALHNSQPPLSCYVLVIPNAHAAAVTAVAYLGPSPRAYNSFTTKHRNAYSQVQQHIFATTGPDQRLQLWRVSFDLAKPGVEGFRVQKGGIWHTTVADAACLEVVGWERKEGYNYYDDCDCDVADDDQDKQNDDEKEDENKIQHQNKSNAAEPQTQIGPQLSKDESEAESEEEGENQKPVPITTITQTSTPKTRFPKRQQQQQQEYTLRILVAGIGLEVRNLAWISSRESS